MKNRIKRYLPTGVQNFIAETKLWNVITARRLALGGKRVDLCAAQVAHNLHLAKIDSLEGKSCLEIGAGWLLSHAIVYHLLGAKKVVTTDVASLAQLQFLHLAIQKSIPSVIRDILSPFENHAILRQRLDNLLSINRFDYTTLEGLGIEYIAPVDLVQSPLNMTVDVIYSNSVLEHIPEEDIPLLIEALIVMLEDGGIMLHAIHLEDHLDFKKNPFHFLGIPTAGFSREMQQSRGNRIRASRWLDYFTNSESLETITLYQWHRKDCSIPKKICPFVIQKNPEDTTVSHLGLYCRKVNPSRKGLENCGR